MLPTIQPGAHEVEKLHELIAWTMRSWNPLPPQIALLIGSFFLFPWGMSFYLTMCLAPVLTLLRPIRDWQTASKVSAADFIYVRCAYVYWIAYSHSHIWSDSHGTVSDYWWPMLFPFALTALGYASYLLKSVTIYDPVPEND
jgi:hypothetical protein